MVPPRARFITLPIQKIKSAPIDVTLASSGESHVFAANVSQQEQLRDVKQSRAFPVNEVERKRGASPELSPPPRTCGLPFSVYLTGNLSGFIEASCKKVLRIPGSPRIGRNSCKIRRSLSLRFSNSCSQTRITLTPSARRRDTTFRSRRRFFAIFSTQKAPFCRGA